MNLSEQLYALYYSNTIDYVKYVDELTRPRNRASVLHLKV